MTCLNLSSSDPLPLAQIPDLAHSLHRDAEPCSKLRRRTGACIKSENTFAIGQKDRTIPEIHDKALEVVFLLKAGEQ